MSRAISPTCVPSHPPRPSRKRAIIAVPRNPTTDSSTSTGRNVPRPVSTASSASEHHADDEQAVEGDDAVRKRRTGDETDGEQDGGDAEHDEARRRSRRDFQRSRARRSSAEPMASTTSCSKRETLRRRSPRSPSARTWTYSVGGSFVASTAIVPGAKARMLATVLRIFGESVRIGQRTTPDASRRVGGDDLVGHVDVGHEQLAEHGGSETTERPRSHDEPALRGDRWQREDDEQDTRHGEAAEEVGERDLVPQHHPGHGQPDGVGEVAASSEYRLHVTAAGRAVRWRHVRRAGTAVRRRRRWRSRRRRGSPSAGPSTPGHQGRRPDARRPEVAR